MSIYKFDIGSAGKVCSLPMEGKFTLLLFWVVFETRTFIVYIP